MDLKPRPLMNHASVLIISHVNIFAPYLDIFSCNLDIEFLYYDVEFGETKVVFNLLLHQFAFAFLA